MKTIILSLWVFFYISFAYAKADKMFQLSSSEKIDITADALTVDNIALTGSFSGTVRVKQGQYRLQSDFLTVHYEDVNGNKTSKDRVRKIVAHDNVYLQSQQDRAKSDKIIYDLKSQNIELIGNVSLMHQNNILTGEHLLINVDTQKVTFLPKKNKRIHGLIHLEKKK